MKMQKRALDFYKKADINNLIPTLTEWKKLNLEKKSKIAYFRCWFNCKINNHRFKKLVNVEDVGLENWFTEKHYQEWSKKSGNDWRGVINYELSKKTNP